MKLAEKKTITKVTNMLSSIKKDDPDFETKMIDCQEVLYWLGRKSVEVADSEIDKLMNQARWKK